jgi:hypothetical protein
VEDWRGPVGQVEAENGEPAMPDPVEPHLTPDAVDASDDEPAADWPRRIGAVLLAVAAVAWIGLVGWRAWAAFEGRAPDLAALTGGAAILCMPLTLIGVAWMLLQRTSRREARRFAHTAAAMRAEANQLEQVLATLSAQIAANRRELADHAHQLLLLGDEATARLSGISAGMREETAEIARHSQQLGDAAKAARGDMTTLLQDLPRATTESGLLAAQLKQVGIGAQQQAHDLSAALAAITQEGGQAEEAAGSAAERLSAQLARIEQNGSATAERIGNVADDLGGTVDAALGRAASALEDARGVIDAQAAALIGISEQARVALEQAGADAAEALNARLDRIGARLDDLAGQIAAQSAAGGAMVGTIDAGISAITGRMEALGATGNEQSAELSAAFAHLGDRAGRIDATLVRGVQSADALIERANIVNGLLRESSEELRIALPQSFDRLEQRLVESSHALAALGPQAAALAGSANDAAAHLHGADALLLRQATTMRALGLAAEERLAAIHDQAAQLEAAINGTAEQARALADGAGPQLIDTLLRVRETAHQAAEHARDAFTSVIPAAAATLGTAAREALSRVLDDGIEERMAEVAATSEQALEAAQRVTERLMRQMLTIADTTAAAEARIAEARAEAEEADEETFSRRVTLLIDQLNSTAINVAGVLSQEVTETSWASYLKGDRGIFTRRAVRLLDGAEVREVLRLYNDDAEFREQLNRYVHDFEAMLRRVLASREGAQLAVTLLSSDMGKLYVALAQAIERLRA